MCSLADWWGPLSRADFFLPFVHGGALMSALAPTVQSASIREAAGCEMLPTFGWKSPLAPRVLSANSCQLSVLAYACAAVSIRVSNSSRGCGCLVTRGGVTSSPLGSGGSRSVGCGCGLIANALVAFGWPGGGAFLRRLPRLWLLRRIEGTSGSVFLFRVVALILHSTRRSATGMLTGIAGGLGSWCWRNSPNSLVGFMWDTISLLCFSNFGLLLVYTATCD